MTWLETILQFSSSKTQSNSQTLFTVRRDILRPTVKMVTWLGISGAIALKLSIRSPFYSLIEELQMDSVT